MHDHTRVIWVFDTPDAVRRQQELAEFLLFHILPSRLLEELGRNANLKFELKEIIEKWGKEKMKKL